MESTRTKVDGADYSDSFIYSFSSEQEFVDNQMATKVFQWDKDEIRELKLKGIYTLAMAKVKADEPVEEVKAKSNQKSKK